MAEQKAKSNSVITTQVLADGVLLFKVKDAGELRFDPAKAAQPMRLQAERHGWTQRISDAAALSRDPATGKAAKPEDKLAAMRKVVEHYESGTLEWRMAGSGGGGGAAAAEKALLVRCLREIYPEKTQEQLAGWVDKRTAQERTALLGSEKIKQWAELFRAEQTQGLDAEALLGELDEVQGA